MRARDVAVVGSFMMDLTVRVARRPAVGETVVGTDFQMFLGGKGFNQAVAAARAGARTAMIGRVGSDDFGARFVACLRGDEIDASQVEVDAAAGTGVGAPVVDAAGENSIVVVPRANAGVDAAAIDRAGRLIAGARVLLLQLELPIDAVVRAAQIARDAETLVVLNPAPALGRADAFAGLVDVLAPNWGEAVALAEHDGDPVDVAQTLRARFGARAVVITLGHEGALLLDQDEPHLLPAVSVQPVDTVGAGDAFCGAFGARVAGGEALVGAAAYANAAASISVTRRGAEPSFAHEAEIRRALDASTPR